MTSTRLFGLGSLVCALVLGASATDARAQDCQERACPPPPRRCEPDRYPRYDVRDARRYDPPRSVYAPRREARWVAPRYAAPRFYVESGRAGRDRCGRARWERSRRGCR